MGAMDPDLFRRHRPPSGRSRASGTRATQTMLRCTRCGDPICPDCMRPARGRLPVPVCARGRKQEIHRPAQQVTAVAPGRGLTLTNVLLLILRRDLRDRGRGRRRRPRWSADRTPACSCGWARASAMRARASGRLIGIGAGEHWRLVTADLPAREPDPPRDERLRAVGLRQHRGSRSSARPATSPSSRSAGLFASAASFVFGVPTVPGVGASGAIFAMLGAFFGYAWRRRELAFYAARIRNVAVLIVINAVFAFQLQLDRLARARGRVRRRRRARAGGRRVQGARALLRDVHRGVRRRCSRSRRSGSPRTAPRCGRCTARPASSCLASPSAAACPRRRSRRGTPRACRRTASRATPPGVDSMQSPRSRFHSSVGSAFGSETSHA